MPSTTRPSWASARIPHTFRPPIRPRSRVSTFSGASAADINRRLEAVDAPFGREQIESIIPHRDPFLFLDEVLELEPGRRVVARRRVRPDEWFFAGHFPGRPI